MSHKGGKVKEAKYRFPPPNKQKKGTSYPKGILQGKKKEREKERSWMAISNCEAWTIDNNTRF